LWGKISFLKGGIFLGISPFSKGGMGGFWRSAIAETKVKGYSDRMNQPEAGKQD
jgi:hypothetical protein